MLKALSAERVAKELLRLLEAVNPAPVLRMMAATGILSELLPGALQLSRLERLVEIDADEMSPRDGVRRLAALLPDAATARAAASALKLSNADRARLEQALDGEPIAAPLAARSARILLYRLGPARFRDKLWLAWADAPRRGNAIQWRMLLDMADNYQRPRFPLTGLDVMQAGVPEGPDVGRVLAKLEDWWVDGDFAAGEADLREKLTSILNGA
jgi:poly(A) polymerase